MDDILLNRYKRVINKAKQKSSATTYIQNSKVLFSRIEDGGYLDCEAWFNRYLATVFDCSKARLKQRSGTCSVNAVINGFLLDKTFRNMFMFSLFIESLEVKENATKPLTHGDIDYFKEDFNLHKYIFQILYTCICRKKTFFTVDNYEADFLLEYGKALEKDHGHHATKIFKFFMSSFPVEINTKIILARYHDLFVNDTFLKVVKIKETGLFYSLTFALIHIRFTSSPLDNHIVTGYICNGVPKVYDSNGLFYNYDWVTGKNLDIFLTELSYNYKLTVSKILTAPIYIENELKKSFDNFKMTDDEFCSSI
jgi:hypothetical protein